MIKVYIKLSQLHNFLIYKEPVMLETNIIDDKYIELNINTKDLIFNEYSTYITIELKTFRKVVKQKWKKIKKIFKK